MVPIDALFPLLIFLVAGGLSIVIMRGLRLSPIIGYLIAGALLGPFDLGWLEDDGTTHFLAELGIVFLLFDIGLHFSLNHLWQARRDILGFGPLQILFCTLALGGFVWFQDTSIEIAIVLGSGFALSSTAVVAQSLNENGRTESDTGRTALAVLIYQDIWAILLLILAASLETEEANLPALLGSTLLKGAIAFTVAILIGRYLVNYILAWGLRFNSRELFTILALLTVLCAATITGLLELSLTLGAFIGGMILAESHFRKEISEEVRPFQGLLFSLFFISVGMTLDYHFILERWWEILIIALLLMATKTMLITLAARCLNHPWSKSLRLGILLSQGSEFAFVLLSILSAQGHVDGEGSAILIASVAVTMALTPIFYHFVSSPQRENADW